MLTGCRGKGIPKHPTIPCPYLSTFHSLTDDKMLGALRLSTLHRSLSCWLVNNGVTSPVHPSTTLRMTEAGLSITAVGLSVTATGLYACQHFDSAQCDRSKCEGNRSRAQYARSWDHKKPADVRKYSLDYSNYCWQKTDSEGLTSIVVSAPVKNAWLSSV